VQGARNCAAACAAGLDAGCTLKPPLLHSLSCGLEFEVKLHDETIGAV
jgi:hypothetical protein